MSVSPLQSIVGVALALTDTGDDDTSTFAVTAETLPQLLVATSVYTPDDAVLTVNEAGLRSVEVKLLGPLQE